MTLRTRRRALAPSLALLALVAGPVLAGCSRADRPEPVQAGAPATSTAPAAAATPTTSSAPGSPVAGLDPTTLRAAVTAPSPGGARTVGGPVAERVVVAGRMVWRVRIPGRFAVRDARGQVLVGGRVVGAALVTPQLTALVAVVPDGRGLTSGAPVAYRYEGSAPVAAGRLAVAR